MSRRPSRAAAVLASAALCAGLVGCSGGDDEEPAGDQPGATGAGGAAPAVSTARFGRVTGTLAQGDRRTVKRHVSKVVDAWVDAAYLGDYPRTDFRDAYPAFTPGATRRAKADRALMSNAALAPRLDGVTALRRTATIDVLAVRKRAVGVTAHFSVLMQLSGKVERRDRVRGSLYLTWDRGWKVFGYDVERGTA